MGIITVRESGGDYSTLADALSNANTGDTINIEGTWSAADTSACTVADDNLTIQTNDANSMHPGYEPSSPTCYRLEVSGAHCITVNNTGCVIDGLLVAQTGTGDSDECIRMACDGGTLTVKNSVLWADTNTGDQDGIYAGNISCTVNCENVICYGFGRAGFHPQPYTGNSYTQTWNLNSCDAWNCGRNSGQADGGGVSAHAGGATNVINLNIFNCVFLENDSQASDDYNQYGVAATVNWDIHNSIDSDNSIAFRDGSAVECLASRTATDSDSPGAGDWVVFEDITSSPYDLRLKSNAENDAEDMHSTGSGAGLTMPSTDIVGTTRAADYECGAFTIAVGETTLPDILKPKINQVIQIPNFGGV